MRRWLSVMICLQDNENVYHFETCFRYKYTTFWNDSILSIVMFSTVSTIEVIEMICHLNELLIIKQLCIDKYR